MAAALQDGRCANVVLLGPPAAGKGTQAELLSERYGMVHISMGDLLRARAKFLPELAGFMHAGQLVPDDIASQVLKERLADRDCAANGVLLDGYPRTRAQAEALRAAGVCISAVIHLQVADEIVVERFAGRRIDPLSGKIYHVKHNPPPPEVASRVIQRDDDTVEKVQRRLSSYHAECDAITSFYGPLVKAIEVGGPSPSSLPADAMPMQVFDEVRKALEGDTYWGSVVRQELVAKAYECGTHSATLVTVARYFEHSRFRLLRNGCLADATAQASRVVLRAQVLQLAGRLEAMATYQLRAWVERVGRRTVVVGHAVSQRLANGDSIDVARGSAAVNFLGRRGEALEVPDAHRLRELAATSTALRGHSPVSDAEAATPEAMAEVIGPAPPGVWLSSFCLPAVDLDSGGWAQEASCLAYCERLRFDAAMAGGYGELGRAVLQAYTVRAYVSYMGYAAQGDRIEAASWAFEHPPETAIALATVPGTLQLAFEFCMAEGGAVLIRACIDVMPTGQVRATSVAPTASAAPGGGWGVSRL